MNNIKNDNYNSKSKETPNFKLNFFSLIDKTISSILPIQYEFPLEKIETNIKEEQEYHQFIYSLFIPKLEQFINENYSYYKIIAIEQKIKYEKIINQKEIETSEIKNLINNKFTIIKLNEKSFEEIRNDILNRIFIEFINKSSDKNYTYNFLNENEYLELLPLKNIISYKKINEENSKLGIYEYQIFISLEDFIIIRNNIDLYIQFKFWFYFFVNKMNLKIIEIEYEYYTNFINEENKNEIIKYKNNSEIKKIVSNIFKEYLNFVYEIINYTFNFKSIHKTAKCDINLYLIDNTNWIDYLEDKLGKDFLKRKEIINYKIKEINNINFEKLIFNNICIKLYGKYSSYNFKNLLDSINNNNIENIIININNFNNFEYIEIIQNEENYIKEIKNNAIKIFSFLTKFLIKIKKSKLKSIVLFIKGFNNSNILLKGIQEKFNEFIKELIKQSTIVKDIKIFFSNIFSEGKEYKSDSIYNFSCLDEKEYNKFNITKNKKKQFKLLLFDNNINIRKNKIIDFYFFEQYSLKRIQDLCLGYFMNILELNRFLSKIKIYELFNMKQFTCFLKSNHKIKEKSLATFFKLDWPKNTLTSIKIIFENFVKTIDIENENENNINSQYNKYLVTFDMYKIYNSIINEFYFKTESKDDINKLIQGNFEGTMINDKKSDKSFEQSLNIIKLKKSQDKSIISTKNIDDNNTNMSYIQQSNNIFLQTKEGSINSLLKNRHKKNFHYINDIKSVEEYHNNNYYNFTQSNQYQKYPLRYFYIIKSETYLKYFTNTNSKEFLKNTYLYNETIEVDNIGKKTEEKYKTYLNFKKSLVIINKNMRSIFGLIFVLNKTKNKNLKKLVNTRLRYKVIHYQYYQRNPVLLDYIISFMNNPIFIYNDFKHSNKLFKKVIET